MWHRIIHYYREIRLLSRKKFVVEGWSVDLLCRTGRPELHRQGIEW